MSVSPTDTGGADEVEVCGFCEGVGRPFWGRGICRECGGTGFGGPIGEAARERLENR